MCSDTSAFSRLPHALASYSTIGWTVPGQVENGVRDNGDDGSGGDGDGSNSSSGSCQRQRRQDKREAATAASYATRRADAGTWRESE
eukprot:2724458-Pleurochrysis_carterae.AAC.3